MYRLPRTRLLHSIIVSVTHRGTVEQHHEHHLKLPGDQGWELDELGNIRSVFERRRV